MHSLFFRIFILFWVAMVLIVGGSMALTVAVASRENDTNDTERRPEMAVRASQVLASGGLSALRRWLQANQNVIAHRDFYIVDAQGRDILGRPLSEFARRRLDFLRHVPGGLGELGGPTGPGGPGGAGGPVDFGGRKGVDGPGNPSGPSGDAGSPGVPNGAGGPGGFSGRRGSTGRGDTSGPGGPDGPGASDRALPPLPGEAGDLPPDAASPAVQHRWPEHPSGPWPGYSAPQLIGPDGAVYTILFSPRRPGLFGVLSMPGIPLAVLALALLVSALTCGWLARHLSAPIRRMQEGARSVASGQLDLRVSAGLEGRRDELAVLARDFDAMADKLRATREQRTQLLRDISHELRSPLARIRLALGLARQSPADPQRQLDRMELEIERLDSLISQILKLARLQSAGLELAREPVDLNELIEDVVADARFEAQAKNCRVEVSGTREMSLPAHRELLRSAIENVLRNAVRYSPEGGRVEVDVREEPGVVNIRVRDRGPGVPPQELQRIFEPFYRVAESRDRDSGGEGIGLAITAQVMQAHGGRATASNRDGGGLEVALWLPRPAPVADGIAAYKGPPSPQDPTHAPPIRPTERLS